MAVRRKKRLFPLLQSQWSTEFWLFWIFVVLFIGFRHEVGADWFSYLRYLDDANQLNFWEIFALGDPGYIALNWFSNEWHFGIVGVNLISGAIFVTGLVVFCRTLQRPWLALTIAVPYLVIVVGMGYTRQAAAIGLIMTGFASLQRGNFWRYIVFVLFAATFHKTAVVMAPFAIIAVNHGRTIQLIIFGMTLFLGFIGFLSESIDDFQKAYFDASLSSSGTLIRLIMSAAPAIIFMGAKNFFNLNLIQKKLWTLVSLSVLLTLLFYFLSDSSTAVDRLALYFMPIQLLVFSSLPDALHNRFGFKRIYLTLIIINYYAIILLLWMFFASHANSWIPYRIEYFTLIW